MEAICLYTNTKTEEWMVRLCEKGLADSEE
jgi:hypothetical protein